jgi:hypothetical protein
MQRIETCKVPPHSKERRESIAGLTTPSLTGEWEIGRIYETRGGPDSLRWFWSVNANGPMTRSDRVATLEEAKASLPCRRKFCTDEKTPEVGPSQ